MPRDYLGATADDHLVDITANLHLVMGIGHRHRVVVAAVAHHGDRRRPGADLLTGIIGRGRQHHQRVKVSHEPFTDRLAVAAHDVVLALQALFLQPAVQRLEALEAWHRHHVVAPAIADHALHIALVVPLARPAEPILEQVMRLQLGKSSGPVPFAVAADLRHRDRGVVIQDRQRHAAKECEGGIVPVAECLGRLGRVGLDETSRERVRVRCRHCRSDQWRDKARRPGAVRRSASPCAAASSAGFCRPPGSGR